jgi:hypothetical protein
MKRALPIWVMFSTGVAFPGPLANNVGFYHWGGQYVTSMIERVERIAQLSGHVARVVLAPTYYRDYNSSTDCNPGYDGTTFGDCEHARFLNPSPDSTAAVSQEYADLGPRGAGLIERPGFQRLVGEAKARADLIDLMAHILVAVLQVEF